MKFNIKSKKGFTLIELLVVIGILAVLAAIAIPSVAGLIDRANVSADNTNANEYTNAIERFTSEYELYKQDITSGTLKDNNGDGVPDNMDASQSRVYNVTKAVTRRDIERLETVGLNGIRIDIDNKYAQNNKTAKAILQNYTKTSSSTFEPKQSDMTYWYHISTGYTVVADKNADSATLMKLLPQELQSDKISYWIDLSAKQDIPDLQVTNALYINDIQYDREGILFYFTFPNPKYEDIDLSKVHFLARQDNDVALTIETATAKKTIQGAASDVNNNYINKSTDPLIEINTPVFVDENGKNKVIQFRVAYECEINGKIEYFYSPIYKATCNELIEQGKIYIF